MYMRASHTIVSIALYIWGSFPPNNVILLITRLIPFVVDTSNIRPDIILLRLLLIKLNLFLKACVMVLLCTIVFTSLFDGGAIVKVRKNIYIDESVIIEFDIMRARNRREFPGGFSAYVEKIVRADMAQRANGATQSGQEESVI